MMACRGTVLAFDVDNTLVDAAGQGYAAAITGTLDRVNLGAGNAEACSLYESIRLRGDALERIGLQNPIHQRGNVHSLAVLCMTGCTDSELRNELRIKSSDQHLHRGFLNELDALNRATRNGSIGERFGAETRARAFCKTDPRVARFRDEANRIARHPMVVEWAEAYRSLELAQPVEDMLPLMQSLSSRGFIPVVISEGRSDIQFEKLKRLGLLEFFAGRILITENAGAIVGLDKLDLAMSKRIDDSTAAHSTGNDEMLNLIWYFRCLIDSWMSKTSSFFGRCLHALHRNSERPQRIFDVPNYDDAESWREKPLRFVMVGDKYDKDVEPLIDLLGPNVGFKIRLRMGKYGHMHPESELPEDRRPDRTFTDWDSLEHFLTEELSPDMVSPITRPPDLAPRSELRPDYIRRGLDSEFEAVRCVATALAPMLV